MDSYFIRRLALFFTFWTLTLLLSACGYSREEKQRMKNIEKLGRENAVNYVKEKYGFTPETDKVQICTSREDGDPLPWANGYVLVSMRDGDKDFKVHISGEKHTLEAEDDYQHDLIMEDAREYLEDMLGYEIYDIYMEYKEGKDSASECHEGYFLEDFYEAGSFEKLLKRCEVNLRIDDCINQDFTDWKKEHEGTAAWFENCANEYDVKAILISYKSVEDYEKGYSHTYARGGLLDFAIEKDGLYICSYAAFGGKETQVCRFERQECEGMIFCCIDKVDGNDLQITDGQELWLDLGEMKEERPSAVYSVDKEEPGEIVVYIPVERYGRGVSVFIQHFYDGRWWQYEEDTHLTTDKQYMIVTSVGYPDSSFDFAVFK